MSKFSVGDVVICPCHGAGEIVEERSDTVNGISVVMYVVKLSADNMTISVPIDQAENHGMLRHVSSREVILKVLSIFRTKGKFAGNVLWNKRINAYKLKINSGCIKSMAEVVRDLHRSVRSNTLSHSEKAIYDSTLSKVEYEISLSLDMECEVVHKEVMNILDNAVEGVKYISQVLEHQEEKDLESVSD